MFFTEQTSTVLTSCKSSGLRYAPPLYPPSWEASWPVRLRDDERRLLIALESPGVSLEEAARLSSVNKNRLQYLVKKHRISQRANYASEAIMHNSEVPTGGAPEPDVLPPENVPDVGDVVSFDSQEEASNGDSIIQGPEGEDLDSDT